MASDPSRLDLKARHLQADIHPEKMVSLDFDPRREDHSTKLLHTRVTPLGWKAKRYLDPWLSLHGRLLDGNRFRLEVTEHVEVRQRWRKSRSGTHKHKHKRWSKAFIRVRLGIKPKRYTHLDRLGAAANRAVRRPPSTRLEALGVEPDGVDSRVLEEKDASAR